MVYWIDLFFGNTQLFYSSKDLFISQKVCQICYLYLIITKKGMINIFRSKQYKLVSKLLQNNGFNNKEFKDFKLGDVAREVVARGFLHEFKQIIRQQKMTHLKLLKATLLVLHMLQISQKIQENPQIQEIIRQLHVRTKAVMHYSRKPNRVSLSYSSKKVQDKEWEGNNTTKQLQIGSQGELGGSVQQNSVSYLLGKLVQPLLHIEEKVLYSHEQIYRSKAKMDSYTCWATLNLLKKYSELGRTIEEIGRYYKEYSIAMICTIRVLSLDIRLLYRRVADYLKKECSELQVTIELSSVLTFQMDEAAKLKEVGMLVQELDVINQNVRVLYCNKYFCDLLVLNNIYMPTIFSTSESNLQVLFSFIDFKRKLPRRDSQCRVDGLLVPPKLNKNDSLEKVESV